MMIGGSDPLQPATGAAPGAGAAAAFAPPPAEEPLCGAAAPAVDGPLALGAPAAERFGLAPALVAAVFGPEPAAEPVEDPDAGDGAAAGVSPATGAVPPSGAAASGADEPSADGPAGVLSLTSSKARRSSRDVRAPHPAETSTASSATLSTERRPTRFPMSSP